MAEMAEVDEASEHDLVGRRGSVSVTELGLVHGTIEMLHAPTGHDTLWSACASRNAHHNQTMCTPLGA